MEVFSPDNDDGAEMSVEGPVEITSPVKKRKRLASETAPKNVVRADTSEDSERTEKSTEKDSDAISEFIALNDCHVRLVKLNESNVLSPNESNIRNDGDLAQKVFDPEPSQRNESFQNASNEQNVDSDEDVHRAMMEKREARLSLLADLNEIMADEEDDWCREHAIVLDLERKMEDLKFQHVEELCKMADKIKAKDEALEAVRKKHSSQLQGLEKKMSEELGKMSAELKAKEEMQHQRMDKLCEMSAELKSKFETHSAQVKSLEKKMTEMKQQHMEELCEMSAELKGKLEAHSTQVESLEKKMADMKHQHEEELNKMAAELKHEEEAHSTNKNGQKAEMAEMMEQHAEELKSKEEVLEATRIEMYKIKKEARKTEEAHSAKLKGLEEKVAFLKESMAAQKTGYERKIEKLLRQEPKAEKEERDHVQGWQFLGSPDQVAQLKMLLDAQKAEHDVAMARQRREREVEVGRLQWEVGRRDSLLKRYEEEMESDRAATRVITEEKRTAETRLEAAERQLLELHEALSESANVKVDQRTKMEVKRAKMETEDGEDDDLEVDEGEGGGDDLEVDEIEWGEDGLEVDEGEGGEDDLEEDEIEWGEDGLEGDEI